MSSNLSIKHGSEVDYGERGLYDLTIRLTGSKKCA
jgi:hypothetical protein